MRVLLIASFILFSASGAVYAQHTDLISTQTNTVIVGTWQIQVINSRNQPYIPGNIIELVTENRKADEVMYMQLGTEVRLKILPLVEINRPGFIPLEKIVHITE